MLAFADTQYFGPENQPSNNPDAVANGFFTMLASIDDRQEQIKLLEDVAANEPIFKGMSPEQVGSFVNWKLGQLAQDPNSSIAREFPGKKFGEKGAGYDRFNSATRWIDAAGYNVRESWTNIFGVPGLGSFGELGQAAGENVAEAFGAEGETVETWGQAGRSIPAGLGTFALALVPVAGPTLMTTAAYGGAVDDAKSRGASSGKAMAAGTLDAAVNLLTMRLGTSIGNKTTDMLLAKSGAAKALMDTSQNTGRALLREALEAGTISRGKEVGIYLGSEALTNAVQTPLGVAGEIAREFVIDPEQAKLMISNPDYWATTIATESGMAAFGAVVGRYNHAKALDSAKGQQNDTTATPVDPSVQQAQTKLDPRLQSLIDSDPNEFLQNRTAGSSITEEPSHVFSTESGSTYSLYPRDGSSFTQRFLPEGRTLKKGETTGFQSPVARTVFVDEATRSTLANSGLRNERRVVLDNDTNTFSILVRKQGSDTEWERHPTLQNLPFETVPRQEAFPLEGHKQDSIGWISYRMGSKIVNVDTKPQVFADTAKGATATDASTAKASVEDVRGKAENAVATDEKLRSGTPEEPATKPAILSPEETTLEVANRLDQDAPTTQTSAVPAAAAVVEKGENAVARVAARTQPGDWNDIQLPANVRAHVRGDKIMLTDERGQLLVELVQNEDGTVRPTKVIDNAEQNQAIDAINKSLSESEQPWMRYGTTDMFHGAFDPKFQLETSEFFNASGITQALQNINGFVRFVEVDPKAKNLANSLHGQTNMSIVGKQRADGVLDFTIYTDSSRLTAPHEMGHLVDIIIDQGGFGDAARTEWQGLKDRITALAPEDDLSALLASKVGKKLDIPGTVEQIRAYRQDPERMRAEFAAEAFNAYALDTTSKFRNYFRKNFPELDKLFARLVDSFSKVRSKLFTKTGESKRNQALSYIHPEYQQIKQFFDRLFNPVNETGTTTTSEKIKNKVTNHALPERAATAYAEIIATTPDRATQEALSKVVDAWAKSPERDETQLINMLQMLKNLEHSELTVGDVNRIASSGFSDQDLVAMPNIRRLLNASALSLIGSEDVTKLGADVRGVLEQLGDSADLDSYRERVVTALRELAPVTLMRSETYDLAGVATNFAQLLRLDHVVGQWMRGEFPEQKGIPMADARTYQNMPPLRLEKWYETIGERKLPREEMFVQFMLRRASLVREQFPILFKKVKSNVGFGSGKEGFVDIDGNFDLDKKGRGKKARLVFYSKEEALNYAKARNEMGEAVGVSFDAKPYEGGPSSKRYQDRLKKEKADLEALAKQGNEAAKTALESMVGLWTIRVKTDPFKQIGQEYSQAILDNVPADYHAASMRGEGEAARALNDIHSELRSLGFKATQGDALRFTGEFLKTVFNRIRTGDSSLQQQNRAMFGALEDGIKDFHRALETDEYVRSQFNALSKELGVGKPLDAYMKLLEESANGQEGKLRELQNYMSDEWTDFSARLSTVAYNVMMTELDFNKRLIGQGKAPKMDFRTFDALREVEYMNPAQQPAVSKFMGFMQSVQDEGSMQNIEHGRTFKQLSAGGLYKLVTGIENLHHGTFGNIIQIATSHPVFEPFKRFLVNEVGLTNLHGTQAIEEIHLEGELVEDGNGDFRWIKKENGKVKNDSYMHVVTNPMLHTLANTIMRASQKARLTLEQMMKFEPSDVMGEDADMQLEAVNEVRQGMLDYAKGKDPAKVAEDMKNLREAIYRTYAATLNINRSNIKMERNYQNSHTALLLYKGSKTRLTTEQSNELSLRLSDLAPAPDDVNKPARLKLLSEMTGWDPERVAKFDEGWVDSYNKITRLGMLYESSPWYVSEKRFKRWIVEYAIDDKASAQYGKTGTRDFDTVEEATKFMKNPPNGHRITSRDPVDQWLKKGAYRGYTSMVDRAVEHVVASRRELMDIMLENYVGDGTMSRDEADRLVGLVSSMESEIKMEAASGKTMSDALTKRYFKPGREHLDMFEQVNRYVWSTAIERSRRVTDAGFALYGADPKVTGDAARWERMVNAKEMIRTPDTDMQRNASKAAFTMFMAGNVSTALIEVMQFPVSLSHILVENGSGIFNSFRIPAKVAARATQAALARVKSGSDDSIWLGAERALIREAERRGRLNVRNYIDINDDAIENQKRYFAVKADPSWNMKNLPGKALNGSYMAMNKFYGFFNRINAELSLVSAYNVLKETKYKNKNLSPSERTALFEEAMDIADAANGSHGRVGRPRWMGTKDSGMRTVGQLAWSLQSYSSSYIANWLRLISKSLVGKQRGFDKKQVSDARKALTTMTAIQLGAFGAMGIPLVGAIAKVAQTVFGQDPEAYLREWLVEDFTSEEEHAFADNIMYGYQRAAGMPFDLRSRMAVQGLGPLNNFEGFALNEFGGPLLSFAGTAINGWRAVSKGDESPARWATNFLPIGFQRATRMMFFDEGKLFTRGGKFMMNMTPMEKAAAALGFSPSRYTDHVRNQMAMRFANEQDAIQKSRATNEIAELTLRGNTEQAKIKLAQTAKTFRQTQNDVAATVVNKVMQRMFPSETPIGSGPNAQRAARSFRSPLPGPSNAERVSIKNATLQRLGLQVDNPMQALQTAMLMDQAQQFNPYATRSELRRMVSQSRNQPVLPSQAAAGQYAPDQAFGLFQLGQSLGGN